jgi:hypothetical protein
MRSKRWRREVLEGHRESDIRDRYDIPKLLDRTIM